MSVHIVIIIIKLIYREYGVHRILSTANPLPLLRKPEELHVQLPKVREPVADTHAPDTLQVLPIHARRHAIGRRVLLLAHGLGRIVSKHPAPLVDRLLEVLRVERGVGAAVVDPHPRAAALVARVAVEDGLRPLLGRVVDLAVGALRVPAVDGPGKKARVWDAAVDHARGEEVGVSCCHDVLSRVSTPFTH